MLKPIEFLIQNLDVIISVFHSCDCKPKKTWEALIDQNNSETIIPKLSQIMSYNTFKQYLSVLAAINSIERDSKNKKLSKLRQVIAEQEKELGSLRNKQDEMKLKLSKLRHKSNNFDGWTVRLTPKGYYNLCKSFDGKVETIYIGKKFNPQKAREKISEKLTKLRQ